jgi:hypothetical protein
MCFATTKKNPVILSLIFTIINSTEDDKKKTNRSFTQSSIKLTYLFFP